MRFLIDEDVAVEVARCLQQAGHEASLVAEVLGVRTDEVDNLAPCCPRPSHRGDLQPAGFSRIGRHCSGNRTHHSQPRRTRQAKCRHVLALLSSAREDGLKRNINFA